MAEMKICGYLSAAGHDRFYELFHALTEMVLSKISLLHNSCQILGILFSRDLQFFSDANAAAQLAAFTAFSGEFDAAMRRFYWPLQNVDSGQVIAFSMKRWAPYDEAAWDAMFTQMMAILRPLVHSAKQHYQMIRLLSLGSDHVKDLLAQINVCLDDLESMCNSEEVKSRLFRSPHPRR